jgi:hypothetical protein
MNYECIPELYKETDVDKYEFIPTEEEYGKSFKFEGPDGGHYIKKAVIVEMPKMWLGEKQVNHRITYINLTSEEKEELFSVLDAELHDTTYEQLDDMVSSLRDVNTQLKDTIEYYEEAAVENELYERPLIIK